MEEYVLLVLYEKVIDALIRVNMKYDTFIQYVKNDQQVMYLKLITAMYGCLKSARLFWLGIPK